MLKKFRLEDLKPIKTPMSSETKLSQEKDEESVDDTKHRGMIGSLLYLTASRSDIMFSVCLCARFQKDPKIHTLKRYIDTRPNGDALRKYILEGPYTPSTVMIPAVPVIDNAPVVPERRTVETILNMSPENKAYFESKKEAIHLLLTRTDMKYTQLLMHARHLMKCGKLLKGYNKVNPSTFKIDPEQAQRDKDMQKNLALITKYFKKIYKPTNNNLRFSSNSRNKNVDTTPRYKNDNQSGQFRNQRTVNVVGARENVGSPVVQHSGIQYFNCKEFGHFAKECRKPKRVKDSAYHKEKMLLYKQAEQGVQNEAGYNVFANDLQHSEQSESVSNTCLVETDDSNVIHDSPDICNDDIQNDQNDVESNDERSKKGLKTLRITRKEKMLLCKQDEKGVQLQEEQSDWLADTDEEIEEQELEAHYSYMAKIQEVPTADSGTDFEPLEQVQYDVGYNVFANERQHSEQPESISNTRVMEKVDSNVIPDSPNMCDDDIQTDQNAVECDDERVALANLIANLKLDVDENKKIQKQLKKANTTLAYELTECKSILAKTSRTLGESNSIRDSCSIALQNKQTEFERYKTLNDRTVDYEKLKHKLNE
nr:uncharacterized mitochondrial protein AtMg00810-like [Tanacetum cinerariifolium]